MSARFRAAKVLAVERRRHDDMDMWVAIEAARVRVQHRRRARRALEVFVIAAEGAQRLPTATYQQVVDDARVRKGQRPELGRHGEGEQEVLGGDLLLHLALQPLLTLVVLAVRAVAMAAGVRHALVVCAFAAPDLHHGAGRGAAMLHR